MKSYCVTNQMKPLQQYFQMVLFIYNVVCTCSSNFWVCGWNPMVWQIKWNLFSSTFTGYYLFRPVQFHFYTDLCKHLNSASFCIVCVIKSWTLVSAFDMKCWHWQKNLFVKKQLSGPVLAESNHALA